MLSTIKFFWLLVIAILLNACGEFTYKRGATVAQLEHARKMCQSQSSDGAIEKCMQDGGWTIQKLDSFEILTEVNQNAEVNQNIVEPTVEQSNAERSNVEQPNTSHYDKKTTVQNKRDVTENAKSAKTAKKAVIYNPLDVFVVPSWWKSGVKPDAFKMDSDACVEKLGEVHKPDGKTQTVTFAFINCMADKGWKAFKKPKS